MLFLDKESKIYALKKDKYISVSIVMPKNMKASSHKKSISISSVSKTVSKNQDIDINDLFSDVWTQKITPKKKKANSNRIQDIAKKIKTVKSNRVNSLTKKIENSKIDNDTKESNEASSGTEVNEYLAKIQAIVYQHFHVPSNSEGNSVETLIELDPLGKMTDFRVLRYSSNKALNEEADRIKDRLKNVIFPKNPQNKSSKHKVVLISKE